MAFPSLAKNHYTNYTPQTRGCECNGLFTPTVLASANTTYFMHRFIVFCWV